MSSRELTILGTASQAPTRSRSQNSAFLRWDRYGFLFDPGEGTQRQMLLAGIPSSAITHICITHLHGDHSLGLPGVLQRMSLDDIRHKVHLMFPESAREFIERLRHATLYDERADIELVGVEKDGIVMELDELTISAAELDHRVDTYGWRLEEPDGRRMVPEKLAAVGLSGPLVGQLQHEGEVEVDGRVIRVEDVSELRRGQSFAFIMDTKPCPNALTLAHDADLAVTECTYANSEEQLAHDYGHMTASQAAQLAKDAGAQRLVLTHFSQRYPDPSLLAIEAKEVFPDVIVGEDLMRITIPPRAKRH